MEMMTIRPWKIFVGVVTGKRAASSSSFVLGLEASASSAIRSPPAVD